MTRSQCGSLNLHCMKLSFTTPRRFLPAHKESQTQGKAGRGRRLSARQPGAAGEPGPAQAARRDAVVGGRRGPALRRRQPARARPQAAAVSASQWNRPRPEPARASDRTTTKPFRLSCLRELPFWAIRLPRRSGCGRKPRECCNSMGGIMNPLTLKGTQHPHVIKFKIKY
jgi:hypothetical protein